MLTPPAFIASASKRGAAVARLIRRTIAAIRASNEGIAAVEFALILPLMLTMYFGSVEVTQAVRGSSKVDLVANTLANISSQQMAVRSAQQTACNDPTAPCLNDADMTGSNGVFTSASSVMAPFTTGTLQMTISQVNVSTFNGNLVAKVEWSVTNNGGTVRPCNGGGANGALLAGTVTPGSANYQNYLPPTYTASGAPTGRMIIADVIYNYQPGFGYAFFQWSNATTFFKMASIGYYRNRNTGTNAAFATTPGPGAITDDVVTNKTHCP